MTDYNELGVDYQVHTQQVGVAITGYMPDTMSTQKINLLRALHEAAKDSSKHTWIRGYLGVLHHLDGFLVSVERIVEMLQVLQKTILNPEPNLMFPKIIVKKSGHTEPVSSPPLLMGISSERIEIEAETLLLRAVSLLERLSKQICQECNLKVTKKTSGFYHLASILSSNVRNDSRCKKLEALLASTKHNFNGTIVSDGTRKCLRNLIAHSASSPEIQEYAFTVNWPKKDQVLAFDAELDDFPLMGTIRTLAKVVPYYTLRSLGILLSEVPAGSLVRQWSDQATFVEADFEPLWQNPFIQFSAYIDAEEKGPIVSLVRWQPGGFQPRQRHLRSDVFDKASIPVDEGSSS